MELFQKAIEILEAILCNIRGARLTRTRFDSIIIKSNTSQGVPIGIGKCKGVRLSSNLFQTHTGAAQGWTKGVLFYYGDKNQQTFPFFGTDQVAATVIANQETSFIPCKDLQDVWVRIAQADTNNQATPIEIQIKIYD